VGFRLEPLVISGAPLDERVGRTLWTLVAKLLVRVDSFLGYDTSHTFRRIIDISVVSWNDVPVKMWNRLPYFLTVIQPDIRRVG
jgi:hypothetical protein